MTIDKDSLASASIIQYHRYHVPEKAAGASSNSH
jgi:hypothetical protein